MAYFAPYIDAAGLHMPTYEDRLEDLVTAYRNIFGIEAELSAAVPDYQLLSVFAKALDDVSALVLQAYNSRNPAYATGNALDLLLPQYGIAREAGETDAAVRARIRHSLAGRGVGICEAIQEALCQVRGVWSAKVYVNDSDTTDSRGIPAHSIAPVVEGCWAASSLRAAGKTIFDKKSPGIGTFGTLSQSVTDGDGQEHTVRFSRAADKMLQVYLFISVISGGDQAAISAAVVPAVAEFVNSRKIGETLNVPQLYGIAYAADPSIADTFVITDIQVAAPGSSSVLRGLVPCEWNEKLSTAAQGGVEIRWN